LAVSLLLVAGCGGERNKATLRVAITDSPGPYKSVVLSVREIHLVPAGESPDTEAGLPVIPVAPSPLAVDVLLLQFQQQLLGSGSVPVGAYNQLRLVLEPNAPGARPANYVVLADDSIHPLDTPSGQQSGVKILGRFQVESGVLNTVLLDFDPDTAIVSAGESGRYIIKPTGIRIEQFPGGVAPSEFGTISGRIVSSDPAQNASLWERATVCVVDNATGIPLTCGGVLFDSSNPGSADNGKFTAHLPAGNYFLRVTASGFDTYDGSLLVPPVVLAVAAGEDTAAGEISITPTAPAP